MKQLIACGYNENNTLSLITSTPAKILEKDHLFGSLEIGKDANFLVAEGVPGLEIVDIEKIKAVYFRGEKMIQRS